MAFKSVPVWRFYLPLLFQAALILMIPARAIYTQLSGKTVILQTIPVDPYDVLRGYSQTLRYDISRIENLRDLAGWQTLVQQTNLEGGETLPPGTRFYVILQAPAQVTIPPSAWNAIAVSRNFPQNLPENQIAVEGQADYNWVNYGLETYYIPEDQRDEMNAEIIEIQTQGVEEEQAFVVEIKVDPQGNSVPVSLWMRDRNYRF